MDKDEAKALKDTMLPEEDDIITSIMNQDRQDQDQDRDEDEDSSCALLASKLSENYRRNNVTTVTATSSSSLTDFLSSHGILLTMCFPLGSCILPFGVNHIASSWINFQTGVRVIPSFPPTNPQIGLILDPSTRVNINCLYPTDGASDGRSNNGCGPMINDSKYGTNFNNFWNRYLTKQAIVNHKNLNFGLETNWIDIDCYDFFVIPKHQNQNPITTQQLFPFPSSSSYVHYHNSNMMWENPPPPFQDVYQIMWDFVDVTTENTIAEERTITTSDNNNNNSTTIIYYKRDILWFADNFANVMGHPVCSSIINNKNNNNKNKNNEEKSTVTTPSVSSSIIPTTTTNGIIGFGPTNDNDSSFLLSSSHDASSRSLLRGSRNNNAVSSRNNNNNNKPPCPTQNDDGNSFCFPIFAGHQSWPPTIDGFKDVINIMLHSQIIDDFSNTTIPYWNEIVIDLPTTTISDIVMGVFYLDTGPNMQNRKESIEAAKLEAKRLSLSSSRSPTIPVFKMDIVNSKSSSNDILSCVV